MMIKRYCSFLLLVLIFVPFLYGINISKIANIDVCIASVLHKNSMDSVGNTGEYVEELEKQLKKNDSLNIKRNELKDSLKCLVLKLKELKNEHKSLLKEIQKYQNQKDKLSGNKEIISYEMLQEKKRNMIFLISEKEKTKQEKLLEIETKQEKINALDEQKFQLNDIKTDLINNFLKKYNVYLESRFSELSLKKLEQINSECNPFIADKEINKIIVKIQNTIQNKRKYDKVIKVLNSPYNENEIHKTLDLLSSILHCSQIQTGECQYLIEQLYSFKDGLEAFKEFINNLNRCREGVSYTLDYFNVDKDYILPENLKKRIDNKLLTVPYLKDKYEMFFKEFQANPNGHSLIEEEILGQ